MVYQNASEQSWYALRVRTKCEKIVAGGLVQREIVSFLPLYRTRTQWSDRIKTSYVPLFPGYVFAKIERQDLHRVYSIPAFMHVAGRGSTPEPVEESDIDAIRQLVASGSGVAPWPFCTAGQMVEVTHGPLAGLRGVFLRTKGQDRLVVSLPILQRSVATEIDSGNVRPLCVLSDRAGAA